MFSFQAIKALTTGDGGMLVLQNQDLVPQAERIRWFGIDRSNKQKGTWENDIWEVGYKYQMTDIAAAMGLAALHEFDTTLAYRQKLFHTYRQGLAGIELDRARRHVDRLHGGAAEAIDRRAIGLVPGVEMTDGASRDLAHWRA